MSITKNVILLHGYASSGNSSKAHYLESKFSELPGVAFHSFDFNPTPNDFEYMTVTGMINRLRQYILDHVLEDIRLIGSSMGALVGIHYTQWFGGVERLLLLAPAVSFAGFKEEYQQQWEALGAIQEMHYDFNDLLPLRYGMYLDGLNYASPIAPPAPMMIMHGVQDDVVPIQLSREYSEKYPDMIELVEVDSDHRLQDQFEVLWGYVNSFLLV
jgi:pimeloyl-ACP methyl ester carboxylesterase